jgi:hypothetical protein
VTQLAGIKMARHRANIKRPDAQMNTLAFGSLMINSL